MRIMKRAQAEKDGRWAQDTLDKNEKIIIAGSNGGLKSDNTNIAQNVQGIEEITSKVKISDSDSDGGGDDVSSRVQLSHRKVTAECFARCTRQQVMVEFALAIRMS